MFRDTAAGVNARSSYRPNVILPDRSSPWRRSGRPVAAHRPAPQRRHSSGPATISPRPPATPGELRDRLKAAYHRLARLAAVPVADVADRTGDELLHLVRNLGPSRGPNATGRGRRLVNAILRLRSTHLIG